MKKFIGYTVGLLVDDERLTKAVLASAEYNRVKSGGVEISLVSGRNLSPISRINKVTVSAEEFSNRPNDPYNNIQEAQWAFDKLGVSICS